MLRKIAIAILIVTPMLAVRAYAGSFSNGSLVGSYVVNVAGYAHNDGTDDLGGGIANGSMAITGVVTLNGSGSVTSGALNVSYGEDSADPAFAFNQLSCQPNLVSGSYFVKSDGSGFLHLNFNVTGDVSQPCFRGGAKLNLNFALARSLGGAQQVGLDNFSSQFNQHCNNPHGIDLEMDNGTGNRICISDLSLSGKLVHQ